MAYCNRITSKTSVYSFECENSVVFTLKCRESEIYFSQGIVHEVTNHDDGVITVTGNLKENQFVLLVCEHVYMLEFKNSRLEWKQMQPSL